MFIYILIDIVCVLTAFFLLNHKKSLTFYHPGTLLLFYHLLNNTLRFISIANGAPVAFASLSFIEGPSLEEVQRAFIWSDVALLSCGISIFIAQNKRTKKYYNALILRNHILNKVVFVALPIGLWGALSMLYIPNFNENLANFNEWSTSSYLIMVQSWFGLALCGLIYFKGFRRKYLIPLIIFLVIIGLQGGLRYRLILPIIFLVTTILFSKGFKWPPKKQFLILIACSVLFYPLKIIGQLIREGGNLSDIPKIISTSTSSVVSGTASDQVFLDQYAMTLSEIDRVGTIYYGSTFLTILTLAIPRQLWQDKPAINQWQVDISSGKRPFSEIGAIATIYGESYANFRYFGIIFIPALFFYYITRWYKKILNKPMLDLDKFLYALVFCCLIQVLRDGLMSLFVFPVLNSMPLFAIFIFHRMFVKRYRVAYHYNSLKT